MQRERTPPHLAVPQPKAPKMPLAARLAGAAAATLTSLSLLGIVTFGFSQQTDGVSLAHHFERSASTVLAGKAPALTNGG